MKKSIVIPLLLAILAGNTNAARDAAAYSYKSPRKATNLSLLCHLLPMGLGAASLAVGASREDSQRDVWVAAGATGLLAGSIFGPGAGQIYAGNRSRFWQGIGARACLGAGVYLAWSLFQSDQEESGGNFDPDININSYVGFVFLILSGALLEINAARDIENAAASARAHNREERLRGTSLSIAPGYNPSSGTLGLTAAVRF